MNESARRDLPWDSPLSDRILTAPCQELSPADEKLFAKLEHGLRTPRRRAIYGLFFSERMERGAALTYDRIALLVGDVPRTISSQCGRMQRDGILQIRGVGNSLHGVESSAYGIADRFLDIEPPMQPAGLFFEIESNGEPERALRREVSRVIVGIGKRGRKPLLAACEILDYVTAWDSGFREPVDARLKECSKTITPEDSRPESACEAPTLFAINMPPKFDRPQPYVLYGGTPPHAKGSATSRNAALGAGPRIAGHQRMVYQSIQEHEGKGGITRDEVGALTGLWMSTTLPRVEELIKLGYIEACGGWVNPLTGKTSELLRTQPERFPIGFGEESLSEGEQLRSRRQTATELILREVELGISGTIELAAERIVELARTYRTRELEMIYEEERELALALTGEREI